MVVGFAMVAIGYSIFYWGLHHMPHNPPYPRYSLWALLGVGTLFKGTQNSPITAPVPQPPIKFKAA